MSESKTKNSNLSPKVFLRHIDKRCIAPSYRQVRNTASIPCLPSTPQNLDRKFGEMLIAMSYLNMLIVWPLCIAHLILTVCCKPHLTWDPALLQVNIKKLRWWMARWIIKQKYLPILQGTWVSVFTTICNYSLRIQCLFMVWCIWPPLEPGMNVVHICRCKQNKHTNKTI